MYKLMKWQVEKPIIQRKDFHKFVIAIGKYFNKRAESDAFRGSFWGGGYWIDGDELIDVSPTSFANAVHWIGRLLGIDELNPFEVGIGLTHWIDDFYNPRYQEYEEDRFIFETLLQSAFQKSVFDYEICKHFKDPDAPFTFYEKDKKIDEHCNHCGGSVAFGSGKFVNRVMDANDVETRKANGWQYPEGDFVCMECDNGDE